VENRGFWALEAPPKREKQMVHRGLFIGWRVTEMRLTMHAVDFFCYGSKLSNVT
jgi:hypothetical protein